VEGGCVIGAHVFKHPFLIHSGYSGAVLLDDQFVLDNRMDTALKTFGVTQLQDSYGNSIRIKRAFLPQLQLGKQTLARVPAGFFEGALGTQKMSILGGDVLKRFNMIIDAERAYIYLEPNHLNASVYLNK
jgi:hypothetical protein